MPPIYPEFGSAMDYRDLDSEKVKQYVSEKTSLFPRGASLTASEIGRSEVDGDGYVNFIYRVKDGAGNSLIVKQAKPYFKHFGKGIVPSPVERNIDEADINILRAAIVPEYVPKMLHVDYENYLFINEDCGRLGIMRFGLARGRRYPNFPKMMGEFIAKCNFYTSELYLDNRIFKALGLRFTSPEMSRVMENILFVRESMFDEYGVAVSEPESGHKLISDTVWGKKEFRIELLKLRDIYAKKQECLVHGDLHTSNTMISEREMKIIDMEYTHLGPYSSDTGYLLGNLVYTYTTWFYHDEWTEAERAAYREEILGYIKGTLSEYIRVFSECWQRDVKAMFRPYPEYLESLFVSYLQESAGFMGSQICSRVGAYVETFDFDVIEDLGRRNEARALALATAYALLMRRGTVHSPEDIVNISRETAQSFKPFFCSPFFCSP
jgi:5-methylthioribose kinase